jgi:leucyl-tRNA synthetase
MQERYDPKAIEPKWQARWERDGLFQPSGKGEKRYILEMLPYPSGALHMGHARNYLIGDVLARYYRMRGFDVMHPIGWDALGLPAENAAIKEGVHPAIRTKENIDGFKKDMRAIGFSYDWSREISTADPEYYRWNQWFFIKMLERGLVYRGISKVNWCPGCATVIANEQVKEGKCERSGDVVTEREMPEWKFRITQYSQALLDRLDTLPNWPERITKMQRDWIGRSEGVEIDFPVPGHGPIRVFTTRADTIFGATYIVVAPDHPSVAKVTTPERRAEVNAFAKRMRTMSKEERTAVEAVKEGVSTGAYAENPFTKERIPIWVANFVLSDYGTGAVMSVPGHDQRDFEFARKYQLPIRIVIQPVSGPKLTSADVLKMSFVDDGVMVDSGEYSGLSSAEGRKRIGEFVEKQGTGRRTVKFRQRDWGFSRQRYWGTPIPIIYCERCDAEKKGIPVSLKDLPVKLPDIDVTKVLTGRGEPPLAKVPEFINTTCPKCGGPARREAETMDTFVDSTWYFCRYLSPHYDQGPFEVSLANAWLPVDIYVGGPEHAVMHLLYFRFWFAVMKEMGLVPTEEPVTRLVTQGIVNGPDGRKMSKRWGNVVALRDFVAGNGADTGRMFVSFAGPPDKDIDWSDEQVQGQSRFLSRVWRLAWQYQHCAGAKLEGRPEGQALDVLRSAHKCLKQVTADIEKLSFNTAIARTMEFVNGLYSVEADVSGNLKAAMAAAIEILAFCLSPFAPHLAEEVAEAFGGRESLLARQWPQWDPALVVEDTLSYAVQINGKLRGQVSVAADSDEAGVRAAAEADEKVKPHLAGKTVRKVIFVPRRLVNFVVTTR